MPKFTPATCPHCEYDRRFPGFEAGGWMQQDNNGPIVSCPMCNDDGSFPRVEPLDDSDETDGRKLYRARADTLARSQVALGKRRIKMAKGDPGRPVPKHGSGP